MKKENMFGGEPIEIMAEIEKNLKKQNQAHHILHAVKAASMLNGLNFNVLPDVKNQDAGAAVPSLRRKMKP